MFLTWPPTRESGQLVAVDVDSPSDFSGPNFAVLNFFPNSPHTHRQQNGGFWYGVEQLAFVHGVATSALRWLAGTTFTLAQKEGAVNRNLLITVWLYVLS
jgi:hypothetical protein